MKVKLDGTHSPCQMCFMRRVYYDPDSEHCQSCEYNIAVQLLKKMNQIIGGSSCAWCKKYRTGCAAPKGECAYSLDWEQACKSFGLEVVED